MDNWKKFITWKRKFLQSLKYGFKDFEIKFFRRYNDLYVQSNTLLLADVFESFRNMYLKIYELDPAKLLSASGLAWQPALTDILTDIDMLLMIEKGIRRGICHAIHQYAKASNK